MTYSTSSLEMPKKILVKKIVKTERQITESDTPLILDLKS